MAEREAIESQLIQQHLGLIYRSLQRYRGAVDEETMEDLRQTALMTFLTELRKFDHIANEDFLKSVTVRIRGAVIDELRARDHLSRDIRSLSNQIKKSKTQLMAQLGREPRESEICEALNITSQEFQNAMCDEVLCDDVELYDVVSETTEENKEVLAIFLQKELNKLPEDARKVLYLMYIMGLSTQETALALDINEVKVHRLKHKSIEMIKARVGNL